MIIQRPMIELSFLLLVLTASLPWTTQAFLSTTRAPTTTTTAAAAVRVWPTTRRQHRRKSARTSSSSCLHLLSDDYQLVTPAADALELQEGQRLVCVGDVHGDADALRRLLRVAAVVEEEEAEDNDNKNDDNIIRWTAGNTILVQTGDILDRGMQELSCWRLLADLSKQAAAAGGAVICLWGNHEVLNCEGQYHYTTGDGEYQQMVRQVLFQEEGEGGSPLDEEKDGNKNMAMEAVSSSTLNIWSGPPRYQPARQATYEPGKGLLVQPLLSKLKVAVKVGKTLCVHAGLTARHMDTHGGVAGMNQQAAAWVKKQSTTGSIPECFSGANGPIWMRDYSFPSDVQPSDAQAKQRLEAALFCAGAHRMVVGHTVQGSINAACQGKVWRIDTGVSRGVASGRPEVLQVRMENGQEVVSILTERGEVPAAERQAAASSILSNA